MVDDMGDGEGLELEDYPELARLERRTWAAAVPYFVGALVAWVGAAFAEYNLNRLYVTQTPQLHALRQTVLQVLSQSLLYAGLGLFSVGLLVGALRQHDRWRRDTGRWLSYVEDAQDDSDA